MWWLPLVGCRSPVHPLDSGRADDSAAPEVTDPRWKALVAYAQQGLLDWDVPGMQIAIVEHGQITHSIGIGVRDVLGEEPVTTSTRFRAASVTKAHTAMLIEQLIEEGLLDPTVPVPDILPGFSLAPPFDARTLTLDNLLTHTSGLQTNGELTSCKNDGDVLADFVTTDAPTWVQWTPPDVLFNYANIGYAIAGDAAQTVTGTPYADLMAERIFGPLGMTSTTFDPSLAGDDLAVGTTLDPATHELVVQHTLFDRDCAAEWAYGGMITTAEDLARFEVSMLGDGAPVLGPSTFQSWLTGGYAFSDTSAYAYGFSVLHDYEGHELWTHGGTMEGFLSLIAIAPDDDFAIVVLENSDHSTVYPLAPNSKPTQLMVYKALSLYLGTPEVPYTSSIRPSAEWSIFEGDYFEPFSHGPISVFMDGPDLVMSLQDPDLRHVVLRPYSANTFMYERSYPSSYESAVSFVFDAKGEAIEWVILDDGVARPTPH